MTIEISKTEKALRLIATEGISAKEAAERVGISRAAVSKGKLWPSKSTQNIRKLCEMENEIESLRSEIAALKAENESLRKGAERYQWLKSQEPSKHDGYAIGYFDACGVDAWRMTTKDLDQAIYAAMAQGEK